MEEQREESNLHLEDALQPVTAPILQGSETVQEVLHLMSQYENLRDIPAFLVHCPDGLWISTRREALQDLLSKAPAGELLCDLMGQERTPILFPDLPSPAPSPTSSAGRSCPSPTAPCAAPSKAPSRSKRS